MARPLTRIGQNTALNQSFCAQKQLHTRYSIASELRTAQKHPYSSCCNFRVKLQVMPCSVMRERKHPFFSPLPEEPDVHMGRANCSGVISALYNHPGMQNDMVRDGTASGHPVFLRFMN
jgi:hypothetical protein